MAAKILIAEDSVTMRRALDIAFAQEPCELVFAQSGREAITQAQTHQPQVVLIDSKLTDGDGYAVSKALHDNPLTAAISVCLLTGPGEALDETRSSVGSIDAHVVKPFDCKTVIETVTQLLNSPRPAVATTALAAEPLAPAPLPTIDPAAAMPVSDFGFTPIPAPTPTARTMQPLAPAPTHTSAPVWEIPAAPATPIQVNPAEYPSAPPQGATQGATEEATKPSFANPLPEINAPTAPLPIGTIPTPQRRDTAAPLPVIEPDVVFSESPRQAAMPQAAPQQRSAEESQWSTSVQAHRLEAKPETPPDTSTQGLEAAWLELDNELNQSHPEQSKTPAFSSAPATPILPLPTGGASSMATTVSPTAAIPANTPELLEPIAQPLATQPIQPIEIPVFDLSTASQPETTVTPAVIELEPRPFTQNDLHSPTHDEAQVAKVPVAQAVTLDPFAGVDTNSGFSTPNATTPAAVIPEVINAPAVAATTPTTTHITETSVEAISKAVADEMNIEVAGASVSQAQMQHVLEEAIWEIVPQLAEQMIASRIDELVAAYKNRSDR